MMPTNVEAVMAKIAQMEHGERVKLAHEIAKLPKMDASEKDGGKSVGADAGGASKATEGEGGGGTHASQRHAHVKEEEESSDVEKDGSQPMEHVSDVEKTWAFEADDCQQPLNNDWLDVLKANEHKPIDECKFEFNRKMRCGKVFKYDVDITDRTNPTSTNRKSNKRRALHRMEMRVIQVKGLRAEGNMACIDVLQKKIGSCNGRSRMNWPGRTCRRT